MATNLIVELLIAAVAVIALAGGLLLILRRRLRLRLASLRSELGESPEHVDDRSYNLLRIARSEADVLARQGVDVHAATDVLAEADASLRRRDYDGALACARRAHEVLVALRDSPATGRTSAVPFPSMTPFSGPRSNGPSSNDSAPASDGPPEMGSAPPPARLAKNRAESHFQISLLNEEIEREAAGQPAAGALAEVRQGATDAQGAYDRGDYTEALRLALRGRRRLGARIESLPAPTVRIPPSPSPEVPVRSDVPVGTAPCASCGRPLRLSDRFCRGCGASRAPTSCPSCSTPLEPDDKFCAACGATVG